MERKVRRKGAVYVCSAYFVNGRRTFAWNCCSRCFCSSDFVKWSSEMSCRRITHQRMHYYPK